MSCGWVLRAAARSILRAEGTACKPAAAAARTCYRTRRAEERGEARPGPDGPTEGRLGSANFRRLTLAAVGVVYGDIGTSPLYAMRECFHGAHGATPTPENILGVCSLVFWALSLVIVLKYLSFVMRADNNGEGGVLALLALGDRSTEKRNPRIRTIGFLLALFGTALLYGDSMITPAISVLSAVEGLEIAIPGLEPVVVYIALVLLVVLFWLQSRGTERIGRIGSGRSRWLGSSPSRFSGFPGSCASRRYSRR